MKTCSIKECENKHIAKGLCWKHYQRLRRTGSIDDPDYPNKGKLCMVKNCKEEAKSKGMCQTHHQRTIRHGTPIATRRRKRKDGDYIV